MLSKLLKSLARLLGRIATTFAISLVAGTVIIAGLTMAMAGVVTLQQSLRRLVGLPIHLGDTLRFIGRIITAMGTGLARA